LSREATSLYGVTTYIEIIFEAKELMEVVNGTLVFNGLMSKQALQWQRKNALARAILVGVVDER